jgi:hypothetical protein
VDLGESSLSCDTGRVSLLLFTMSYDGDFNLSEDWFLSL